MYFQTQRDLWCHLITGTLPHATVLADAYQAWILIGKLGQHLAKRKLELSSWPAKSTTNTTCNQRLFKSRCVYLIYSFETWSTLQDYQGACGVDSGSLRLSPIQENEIIEMLSCFNELLKEVKIEKQNYISNQSFMNDPRCQSAPDYMRYKRCPNKKEAEVRIDIAGAGDQGKNSYSKVRNTKFKDENETLQEDSEPTCEEEPPQEFSVDISGEESSEDESSSGESATGSTVDSNTEDTLDDDVSFKSAELIKRVANMSKRSNSSDSLIANDDYHEKQPSESEESSHQDDIPESYSNCVEMLARLNGISMCEFQNCIGDILEEEEENDLSEGSSSGFEIIDCEDEEYSLFDEFVHDLPPRPHTS